VSEFCIKFFQKSEKASKSNSKSRRMAKSISCKVETHIIAIGIQRSPEIGFFGFGVGCFVVFWRMDSFYKSFPELIFNIRCLFSSSLF
jgi:hypothetical protein